MSNKVYQPGKLVNYRGRNWMVLPSDDPEIIRIKPLGGAEEETTGIYLPLAGNGRDIQETQLPYPDVEDVGRFESAKLLFHAARLSFRNASGAFRSMGKLSFRPRSYQVVPLVMALKQQVTRLMIADDVGIGKTIEALMILKELMERGDVRRFAVICLPHLCEQWQGELKDKLDIDAKIIRSSTAAKLERDLPDDHSVFHHIPYQVISIDYLKQREKKDIFMQDAPEMVIVDEAHTCARPAGTKSKNQMKRHGLMHDIAQNQDRHLLMLTATPHSGKDEEFRSLLEMLNPEFGHLDFGAVTENQRRKIARYFIQRKRANIKRWLNQVTPFPERSTKEIGYNLFPDYLHLYIEVLDVAQKLTSRAEGDKNKYTHYWAALALLRGVMSSPEAGLEMLKSRRKKAQDQEEQAREVVDTQNPLFRSEEQDSDVEETDLLEQVELAGNEITRLDQLIDKITKLKTPEKDRKLQLAIDQVSKWIKSGVYPIIFCRYIATAKYVAARLKEHLPQNVDVQAITSEYPDEQRREIVGQMGKSTRRVMVATDCLSEGINLQEYFTAVLHYDLPWNPNRLEQREGRVDRFGQTAEKIYAHLLWGQDNPIDAAVLKVLIKKVRDIQKATGVSIVIGQDDQSIIDTVLHEVLLDPRKVQEVSRQATLDFGEEYERANQVISHDLEQAKEKAERLRSIFAHERIKPELIETELKQVDEVIGDSQTVADFVMQAAALQGATMKADTQGYILDTANLPRHLKATLPPVQNLPVSFESPTPKGRVYIGRNHRLVEQLSQWVMARAFERNGAQNKVLARAAAVQTQSVQTQTVVVQFRVRNVIQEVGRNKELVAEEMYLWGYTRHPENHEILDYQQCKQLLLKIRSHKQLATERQKQLFAQVEQDVDFMQDEIQKLAENRADRLVEAHSRFKELVGGRRYKAVHPVLPPDVMGIYILMPVPKPLV